MKGLVELREEFARIAMEAKPLAEKAKRGEALSDAENTRYDELVAALNEVGPQMREAEARQQAADAVLAAHAHANEPAGRRASGMIPNGQSHDGQGGAGGPDLRSPGRRFVQSEQYKRAIQNPTGLMKHDPVSVGSLFAQRYGFDHEGGVVNPRELRALIGSGTAPASMLLPQILPTVYRGTERRLVVRDVLLNARTTSDTIRVMQESGFTNNAAEVAEATAVDGSGLTGGVKPESALTFTEADFPVRWIAHWIPITRQFLEDLPAMEGYINERLLTGLQRREDYQLLNGNGTAPNLRGILNTSGIQVADEAYFTANPVQDAGQTNENLNRLRRAKRLVMDVGEADPTFIVINPADAEVLDTITDANRNYLFGGPTAGPVRTFWGLPAVESSNIAAGTALVGDGTMAGVFDRMDGRIYTTDSHADFFIRNLLVVLAEERLALATFRPAAFVKVTLAA